VGSSALITEEFPINEFAGTLTSVTVLVGHGIGLVNTGPISVALDKSKPATSTFVTDTNLTIPVTTITNSFSIIFDMPLFHTLELPPDTMTFSDTGVASLDITGNITASALSGSGGPSPTFGVKIGDINNNWKISKASVGTWNSPTMTLTFPANSNFDPLAEQALATQGSGTFQLGGRFQVIPEPSTWALTCLSVCGFIALCRRKQKGQSLAD
jgi:hypothetical protein